jgi:AraC-like DNA-binding protein
MPVQVNIFLLLFGALQGLFLSFLLSKKKAFNSGYFFLISYLLIMILQITLKVMSKIWLTDTMMPLYVFSYQLPFLYGPLVYLFVKQITGRSLVPGDIIHFMPLIAVIIHFLFDDAYHYTPPILVPFFDVKWRLFLQLLSLTAYHLVAFRYWFSYQAALKARFSEIQQLRLKWVQQFVLVSFIVCTVISFIIYFMYILYPYHQNIRFGFVILTFFIYWISYCAWNQPAIFNILQGEGRSPDEIMIPKLSVHHPARKYSNSGLSEKEMSKILAALEKLMLTGKPFLLPDLTIDKLAAQVSCSRHHLSQVLNQQLGRSFYDYINYHRVEEAKQALLDPARADHKIASIGYDAGFNSLSAFNDVFKKYTGLSPSQFQKQMPFQSRKQRV